ncbi:helix-turn-helix transcriptional regulator [Paenibacillus sp. GCM10023248]|uniref:helix-turn-helix transcriptional regulator n=1 Tax=Bacillales TaxID=1385 RepID=UPI0023785B7B|nr:MULTISPECIES: helix-turn-helix transcriptional regulator [Bacillales]MDD9269132.1 helix-turn-helix transcriptional regulator [Paenibacillus sp. MAHUQ-63]MDR6880647.1 transcriptional regulator with XRE-family HTH domain [Bacillus sp. 3255]
MDNSNQQRLRELAQFLRTRRERLTPEQVGFSPQGRRRTPGLRREEVAILSGVSVDWYTWLEQARDIQVSSQVLESIASALRLDPIERNHLFVLALQHQPSVRQQEDCVIHPTLQSFLDGQGSSPVYVMNQRLDIVAWNQAANLIYGDYEKMSRQDRNSLWRSFVSPYTREMLQETWETHARHRLAQFRANYGKYVGDPSFMELIEALNQSSEEFREWWPQHDVLNGPEGRKVNYHPAVGVLEFDQLSFLVMDAQHLTVTVNVPANEDTRLRVHKLLANSY